MSNRLLAVLVLLVVVVAVLFEYSGTDVEAPHGSPGSAPTENSSAPITLTRPDATRELGRSAVVEESTGERPIASDSAIEQANLPDGRARIVGLVVDQSGDPIPGAAFMLHGWGANSRRKVEFGDPGTIDLPGTTTDAGRIDLPFEPHPAAQYTFDLEPQDFGRASWRWSEIDAGQVVDLGTVVLRAEGRLEVRLRGPDGKAPSGIWNVYAVPHPTMGASPGAASRDYADWDPAGERWSIRGLPPGPIEVGADGPLDSRVRAIRVPLAAGETREVELVFEGRDQSSDLRVSFLMNLPFTTQLAADAVTLWSPSGQRIPAQVRSSNSIEIAEAVSGEYRVEVDDPRFERVERRPLIRGRSYGVRLRGSVGLALDLIDEVSGAALEEARVEVTYPELPDGAERRSTSVQVIHEGGPLPEGGVVGGIYPTTARLRVVADGYAPSEVVLEELRPGEVRAVRCELGQPFTLRGRLTWPDGRPVDADVTLFPPTEFSPLDRAHHQVFMMPDHLGTTHTDADGRFELPNLSPGTFGLQADASVFFSTWFPSVAADRGAEPVQLVMESAASIVGHIDLPADSAGRLLVQAVVSEISTIAPLASLARLRYWGPHQRVTSQDGRFDFAGLRAGTYRLLYAVDEDPDFGATGLELATVELAAGERRKLDLDGTSLVSGAIHALVTVDGAPGTGLVLKLARRGDDGSAMDRVEADLGPDGEALLELLPSGEWFASIEWRSNSFQHWSAAWPTPAIVADGQVAELHIDLEVASGALQVGDAEDDRAELLYSLHPDPASDPLRLGRYFHQFLPADGRIVCEQIRGELRLSVFRDGEPPLINDLPIAWPPAGGELSVEIP
ncbi:carboxypeptidase-like regulatory domain-containing protein [Engelhardtia mirabilis]|uniref:Nickel uptake substrate-specific transmembrane region n=1 Tax=Engelhardtia mirabilis TaxID=2528011 RepID=A0A518BDD4_9BACT|nr:hypothetical protein Pla133_00470 [Planctomycetes bacterium Pla133]QDU99311.1 hypothetical protein Pla86_00470 [Planctomycetes bacterium Pla86]